MRASGLHIVTYRDDPAEAEIRSHRLMARAGYIHKVSSGLYVYGPLMLRVLRKVSQIIREEMNAASGIEVELPILQDQALWEQSGRWEVYRASGTMFTTTDRRGVTYGLAPTAEEVMTDYARATVKSYKQLPLRLYQIKTKFRDEIRPRFGLLRVKEFLMKDAYSFDADEAGMDRSFEAMREAYLSAFGRMGLEAFGVEADPGDIGGTGSMEFMIAADTGEDAILVEEGAGYAANVETAISRLAPAPGVDEAPRAMHEEDTPDIRTCEQLAAFFPDVPVSRMVKTLLFKAVHADREECWACLIRGDQEVNEIKLRNRTGGLTLKMLTGEEIETLTGAQQGFAGPIHLPAPFRLLADESVRGMRNYLCGLNRTDRHALDVNAGRDFPEPEYVDVRLARPGEPGPVRGEPLQLRRGIEVGHIFKLGTKYSAAMEARFLADDGQLRPFQMGCFGIGVSRVAAAAVEQFADDKGIVWPPPIALFEVAVACLTGKDPELVQAAEDIYEGLCAAGIDALLDDRPLSPGAKMTDLEMLGFPYAVLIGRSWKNEGRAEVRDRRSDSVELIEPERLVVALLERLGRGTA